MYNVCRIVFEHGLIMVNLRYDFDDIGTLALDLLVNSERYEPDDVHPVRVKLFELSGIVLTRRGLSLEHSTSGRTSPDDQIGKLVQIPRGEGLRTSPNR